MSKILCLGDACVDIITKKNSNTIDYNNFNCGGANANSAFGLGKLNCDVMFFGVAGNDIYGITSKKALEQVGVNTKYFKLVDNYETTKILVEIDENNDRFPTLLTKVNPSYLQIHEEDLNVIDLSDVEYILTNGMMLFENPAASSISDFLIKAHDKGIKILLDINYRIETIDKDRVYLDKVVSITDYLFGSIDDEILPLTGSNNIEEAVSKFNNKVVIARNSKGASVYSNGNVYKQDSYKVEVVDTLGAGDAYNAGFIYGLVNNKPLSECNKLGCLVAAINITKKGARNAPSESELLDEIS